MRDEKWLEEKLQFLLKKYFASVKLSDPIEIKWGREAKFRFGSIRLLKPKGIKLLTKRTKPQKSIITITSMFRSPRIPAKIVEFKKWLKAYRKMILTRRTQV